MRSISSADGGHSGGGHAILLSRLKDKKRSWEGGKEPEPDDPQFQELVSDFTAVRDIMEINFVCEGLGDTIISALGRAMVEFPFPFLKSLQLGGNHITEVGIRTVARAINIGHIPALESLGLFPVRKANQRARFVTQEEVYRLRNQVKDEGVRILSTAFASRNASGLKVLTLEQNGFGTDGVKALAHEIRAGCVPNLQVLNVSYNDVGDEGIKLLAKAFVESGNNLEVLDLKTCNIFMDGTKSLATAFMTGNFLGLTELYLGNNDMGRKGPREGSLTPNDEGLMELARALENGQLPKLQILDLEHSVGSSKKVAEAFKNAVRSNQSLVLTLKINWPSFDPYENSVTRYLERNRRNARMPEQLKGEEEMPARGGYRVGGLSIPEMASTSLTSGSYSVGGLSFLRKKLKEKKISWEGGHELEPYSFDDPQSQELVNDFMAVKDITEINLVGDNLGDTIISALGTAMVEVPFPSLKSLQLGGNYLTEKGIRNVATAVTVGHIPALESLGLFPERKANERARFVKANEANWVRNQIKDEGVRILATAFASGNVKGLKVLTLEQNGFGTDGAKAVAHEIRGGHLPNLEVLNLSYNDVGDEGIKFIAEAFVESGNNLKVLDLETCNIFMAGTRSLATAFTTGNFPGLTELYLGNNDMGRQPREGSLTPVDQGLMELARVLHNGQLPKLQMLDLEHNVGGSKRVAEALKNAVRSNNSLVRTLKINWPSFGPYESSVKRCLERNRRIARMLEQLKGEEDVPATNGKIFLCGHPKQGKTTLRRSLQNSWPTLVTIFSREKKFREEPRTRGIEVSHIISKGGREPIKLAIWDLAGQSEYEVLHSAFLPDLAFAHGQATTFVIVCNAEYPRSDTGSEHHGKELLTYWMRFIASSSSKGDKEGKRHVLVVLNRFNNEPCEYLHQWVKYLEDLKQRFREYLEIEETPFVLDARVARSVSHLKEHLIQHTRKKLETKKVPKICQFIQDTIREDVKTKDFPVVPWAVFAAKFQNSVSDEEKLRAAVDYLHESGHLIHFREGWEDTFHEGIGPGRSLVVLDPDWFCRRVVGYLLLPDNKTMLADGEFPLARRVHNDGSIALQALKNYFRDLLRDEQQVSDIVAMLLRLGICYMAGTEKVLIPALISDLRNHRFWVHSEMLEAREQWVMGYRLKVQYTTITMLPIAVFRRLQVELAQDPMFAAADSDYTAGKFNITFGTNDMAVLVESSAHGQDPDLGDQVDILVRPRVSRKRDRCNEKRRELQVQLAQCILERLVGLAESWSPGVEFIRLVVKPWSTAQGLKQMEQRIVTWSVEDLKSRVGAGQTTTVWTVGGEPVNLIDLMSGSELREWESSIREKCDLVEELIVDLGFAPAQQVYPGGHSVESPEPEKDPVFEKFDKAWDVRFQHMDSRMDELQRSFEDIRKDLGKVLSRQRKVLKKLQALERFSRDEVRSSVPRFMYLTKARDASGIWMTLRDIFVQNVTLHFLCEAHYNDHSLHEIVDQEGVEIKNISKFAAKVAPWLIWSLKVAFIVGKVASQAFLPGLAQLMQSIPGAEVQKDSNMSTSVAYWLSAAVVADAEGQIISDSTDTSLLQNRSTPARPVEVKEGLKDVLKDLIGRELKPTEFQSKFKLKRAVVNDSGYVVWICNDCFSKYESEGAIELIH